MTIITISYGEINDHVLPSANLSYSDSSLYRSWNRQPDEDWICCDN